MHQHQITVANAGRDVHTLPRAARPRTQCAVHNDLEDSGQGTKTWNTGPGVPKLRAFGPVHQDLAIVGPRTECLEHGGSCTET